jgi:predicted Zn-ribbon and HTH transcriptional regulator
MGLLVEDDELEKYEREYLANKATRCPICKSDMIEDTNDVQAYGLEASVSVRCDECGAEWAETFRVVGISWLWRGTK